MTPDFSSQPETVHLGGGFVYLRRVDGHAAIVASVLGGSGAVGIMSSAAVNARTDAALRDWLQWWAFPDQARLRCVNQVHGATVVAASSYNGRPPDADGMWTKESSDILVIRVADCAPVWFVDPQRKTIALVHAGWRGVSAGIIETTIAALSRVGSEPRQLQVAVGPHIGPCCFEVGPEVARRFEDDPGAVVSAAELRVKRSRRDSQALDLNAVIYRRLAASGVPPEAITAATACTRCETSILHSYRRNGKGGPLMAAVAAVLP